MQYHSIKRLAVILAVSAYLFGCKKDPQPPAINDTTQQKVTTPVYTYEIVATYPHDPGAFTEGLQFLDGILYEGTGREGWSNVRKVELATGKVLAEVKNDPIYFGEGIVVYGDKIFQVTYLTEKGFVYDKKTLHKVDSFTYHGEGWGLTTDGTSIIMSNGTNRINFLDPATKTVTRSIDVFDGIDRVNNINELEYIKGEIWANIWMTEMIVRIDPATGKVLGWIDMSGILNPRPDVLNGIAYDAQADKIYVTGKLWPKLFEIKIKPRVV